MNQYLMGHLDMGVTMNNYKHLELDDAKNGMIRMEGTGEGKKRSG